MREIVLEGTPVLLECAKTVAGFDADLADLIRDMFETMYAASGRGLAAPQVGVPRRVFVIDTDWKDAEPAPMLFVNPQIVARSQVLVSGEEGCLSIPDKGYVLDRHVWVDVTWQDLDGVRQRARFDGIQARCICHENDHLDGILISSAGNPI